MTFIHSPMNPGVYMAAILILLVFATYVSILFLFCKTSQDDSECLFHRLLAIFILFIVIYLGVHRDTFLPFIGETVFPFTLVKDDTRSSRTSISKTVNVNAPDGTKVAYWASMPNNAIQVNPQIAYDRYANSGVTSVKDGKVTFYVDCPSQYRVPPFNEVLEKHIHYRIINTNGMISEVHTVKLKC